MSRFNFSLRGYVVYRKITVKYFTGQDDSILSVLLKGSPLQNFQSAQCPLSLFFKNIEYFFLFFSFPKPRALKDTSSKLHDATELTG